MEAIFAIIISLVCIGAALKILAGLFKWAIVQLKALGSFVVGLIPAIAAVFLSSVAMDATAGEVATQLVATDVVVGAIGLAMFGDA